MHPFGYDDVKRGRADRDAPGAVTDLRDTAPLEFEHVPSMVPGGHMAMTITRGLTGRRGNPGTKGRLLGKSLEAYVLALETINRLTITYRTETFCALVCNAWELLLKATLLDESTNRSVIYWPLRPGSP